MDDIQMLREPGINRRIINAVRSERARIDDPLARRRAVEAGAAGHIFNLGHGVLPSTDPGVVTEAVALAHSL